MNSANDICLLLSMQILFTVFEWPKGSAQSHGQNASQLLSQGYCLYGVSVHVLSESKWVSPGFSSFFTPPKTMPIGVNVYVYVHGAPTRLWNVSSYVPSPLLVSSYALDQWGISGHDSTQLVDQHSAPDPWGVSGHVSMPLVVLCCAPDPWGVSVFSYHTGSLELFSWAMGNLRPCLCPKECLKLCSWPMGSLRLLSCIKGNPRPCSYPTVSLCMCSWPMDSLRLRPYLNANLSLYFWSISSLRPCP